MPANRPLPPRLCPLEDRSTPAAIGALDPGFGTAGRVTLDLGGADKFNAVFTQPDGRIVAAGTNGTDAVVVRLLPNGTLDTSFGTNGRRVIDFGGTADEASTVGIDASGRVIVVGTKAYVPDFSGIADSFVGPPGSFDVNLDRKDFAVARLNANGAFDTSFAGDGIQTVDISGGINPDVAYDGTIDASGRLVIVGVSGVQYAAIRLLTDGSLDTTFGTKGIKTITITNDAVAEARSVFVDTDGKIIVAGSTAATTGGLNQDVVAVKLDANGQAFDTAFGNTSLTVGGTTFRAEVIDFGGVDKLFAATRDASGRFLLVGSSGTGADSNFAVARTDPGFNLDAKFGTGGKRMFDVGGSDVGRAIFTQPDGKIIVAGTSTAANGAGSFAVARLTDAAGDLDPTFGTAGGVRITSTSNDAAFAAAPANDGGLVLAGSSGSDATVAKLVGSVGLPQLLSMSGPTGGTVKQYTLTDGKYAEAGAFNTFPGNAASARTAVADVTGDGVPDTVVAAGPGAPPQVLVFDGVSGAFIANVLAFESTFTGGLYVAAGDFNRDGRADIAVSPDQGGGPRVRILDGATLAAGKLFALADFLAIEDANFRGGVRPAVGDVNSDGTPDLVVSAGIGGGPRIAVWDGTKLTPTGTPARLIADFFAFEPGLRDGAFVTAGDVNGDGVTDLAFGGGPNGAPRVLILNGAGLAKGDTGQVLANFFSGDAATRGGVRLALRDVDGDGKADLVTASGDGQPTAVRVYLGTTLAKGSVTTPDQTIDPFGTTLPGGVFVG